MGSSYIVLLTAFYVDNCPRLPVWERLPGITFWFLPSVVGVRLIVRAIRRQARTSSSDEFAQTIPFYGKSGSPLAAKFPRPESRRRRGCCSGGDTMAAVARRTDL